MHQKLWGYTHIVIGDQPIGTAWLRGTQMLQRGFPFQIQGEALSYFYRFSHDYNLCRCYKFSFAKVVKSHQIGTPLGWNITTFNNEICSQAKLYEQGLGH